MGFIRLWLAGIVTAEHAGWGMIPLTLVGFLAVEGFFLFSGYYIQRCITSYASGVNWRRRFYASRLWRILPLYWLMLLLTVVFIVIFGRQPHSAGVPAMLVFGGAGDGTFSLVNYAWAGALTVNMDILRTPSLPLLEQGNLASIMAAVFTNLFVVGQAVLRFMVVDPDSHALFFADYATQPSANWASSIPLLGQAWSLPMEIYFYLLAPLLLFRSSRLLIILAALSLSCKLLLWQAGYRYDINWRMCIFPAELWLFLSGALMCRLQQGRPLPVWLQVPRAQKAAYVFMLLLVIGYSYLYPRLSSGMSASLAFLFLLMPIVYYLPRLQVWGRADKWMAELSYPLYISHYLVMGLLVEAGMNGRIIPVATLVFSIMLSVILVRWVEEPLTVWRHRRFRDKGVTT